MKLFHSAQLPTNVPVDPRGGKGLRQLRAGELAAELDHLIASNAVPGMAEVSIGEDEHHRPTIALNWSTNDQEEK